MHNDLPWSQWDANTDRRKRAKIVHVKEQEGCHYCSGFIDWDEVHFTGSVASPAGDTAVLLILLVLFPHQSIKEHAVNIRRVVIYIYLT